MTTIAYSHKEQTIACDGRLTASGTIAYDAIKKWVVAEGFTMFFCGQISNANRMRDIIDNHQNGDMVDLDGEAPLNVEALVVRDGEVTYVLVTDDGEYIIEEVAFDYAIGSGGCYAQAAMDFGKSAKDAVKYAMTRDVNTGGKVSVCDVQTGKIK